MPLISPVIMWPPSWLNRAGSSMPSESSAKARTEYKIPSGEKSISSAAQARTPPDSASFTRPTTPSQIATRPPLMPSQFL